MDEERVQILFDTFKDEFGLESIDDFKNYTSKELYDKIRSLQNPYPNAFIRCKDNTKLFITNTNLGENIETN